MKGVIIFSLVFWYLISCQGKRGSVGSDDSATTTVPLPVTGTQPQNAAGQGAGVDQSGSTISNQLIFSGSQYGVLDSLSSFNGAALGVEMGVLLANTDMSCASGEGLLFDGTVWKCDGSVAALGTSVETGEIADGAVTAGKVAAGAISDGHISASAAIATTKLSGAVTSISGHGLGTAAMLDAGTDANEMVQLDSSSKLPAVDGSRLTDLDKSQVAGLSGYSGGGAASHPTSTCPTGYIEIPGDTDYGTSDFCVMKYEAKRGLNGVVSVPDKLPLRGVVAQGDAIAYCKNLGPGYALT